MGEGGGGREGGGRERREKGGGERKKEKKKKKKKNLFHPITDSFPIRRNNIKNNHINAIWC